MLISKVSIFMVGTSTETLLAGCWLIFTAMILLGLDDMRVFITSGGTD